MRGSGAVPGQRGKIMNYDQYRELLKKSKPLYAEPTLFGFSRRAYGIAAAVAVVAVLVLG